MGKVIDKIISGHLKPSETLLWSHGVDPEFTPPKKASFLKKCLYKTLWFLMYVVNAYFVFKAGVSYDFHPQNIKVFLLGLGALLLTLWLISLWKDSKIFREKDDAYQNGFLTNERIVFFNNYDDKQFVLLKGELAAASKDFIFGSPALKLISIKELEAFLIGAADFSPAISLLRKEFLVKNNLT